MEETLTKVKEVADTVVPIIKDISNSFSKSFSKRLMKKLPLIIVAFIILFCIIFFLIFAWYNNIRDWIIYGFSPTNGNYTSALASIAFAGVVTVIFVISLLIIYSVLKKM